MSSIQKADDHHQTDTLAQAYPHSQNRPSSILRDWDHIRSHRWIVALRQRTGQWNIRGHPVAFEGVPV